MAATNVRLVVEYRNGDKNFLAMYSGETVKCNGETDGGALDAAFRSLLDREEERLKQVGKKLKRHKPEKPHHD
jgi:hypothetical protein